VAPRLDASQQAENDGGGTLDSPRPRPPSKLLNLSLPARLGLLVVASILPLLVLGIAREYIDYLGDRSAIYSGLLGTAHTVAAGVERDLRLRISALETLAMSPELTEHDQTGFSQQAAALLSRLPPGTLLGLVTPDMQLRRLYGRDGSLIDDLPQDDLDSRAAQVFASRRPVITDMRISQLSGVMAFTIDVPVERDGRVIFDLFIRLTPSVLDDLVAGQFSPAGTVLTVVDSAGHVVARYPNASRYVGAPIVPALRAAIQTNSEGILHTRTLEGTPAAAGYTHIAALDWAVAVGAPEQVIFAPLRSAIIRVAGAGVVVLALGLTLAMLAARAITRPIQQLRRIASNGDELDLNRVQTGLAETDMVARALVSAAAQRRQAAQALAESESRFRALFEKSASGSILLDPATAQIIDCNDVAASIVGYTVAEFCAHKITEFAPQLSADRLRELNRLVAGGDTQRFETRFHGRNGARDVINAVAPIQVAGRSLVLINQIDVTDLRRAEAGLRTNEERLELARQGANLGIWDWNIIDDTLTWSDHQWHLHGLEPLAEGPTPALWRQVIHPADLQRAQDELAQAVKSPGHPYATEYSVILPDGSIRRLLGRGQSIRGPDGRTVRMVGINMDVTVRYEAEMARDHLIGILESERARLTEIIEALPVGIGIVDAAGKVVLGNTMMQRVNGPVLLSLSPSPRGEWIAYDSDGNRVEPENFPIRQALTAGKTTLPGMEFLFRDSEGGERWYRIGSIPLRSEEGQVQEALGIFLDIDAEKRLLEIQHQINARLEQRVLQEISAREAAQQRAAHADRMHALGQIAGGIAHDFNNVLQAVSGGAALIERRPDDQPRVLRNARMVLDAARRGAAITSRLLAFSRRGDLRAEHIDAAMLLADMAEVLSHTLGGSVVCRVHVMPALPPLNADRGQLETVLVNLAANARDAMPSGGTLTLNADIETVTADRPHPADLAAGPYIRIEVVDTGTGMDDVVLARVTEPFFTTKEPGKGTGLGLAMAKGFAEQSGGSLAIESTPGVGTRVSLWLPVATSPIQRQPRRTESKPIADKPKVLLVDDDAMVREVLEASLEDAGFAVHATHSGAAALAWLDQGERLDIIVSDLTMPAMDGLTVIRLVQERRPNLPAILLTGYAGDGAALAVGGAISGTFSLLRKPVSGSQLIDRIAALLASRKLTTKVRY
jgi:PAS domain S-box-containing protein